MITNSPNEVVQQSVYREDQFQQLLDQNNDNLGKDFNYHGTDVEGLPPSQGNPWSFAFQEVIVKAYVQ